MCIVQKLKAKNDFMAKKIYFSQAISKYRYLCRNVYSLEVKGKIDLAKNIYFFQVIQKTRYFCRNVYSLEVKGKK